MRHPFAGLMNAHDLRLDRRSALGCLAVTAVGFASGASQAQVVATTMALGEEGAATNARGEDGLSAIMLTTEPFGEEAGKVTSMPAPGLEDGKKAGNEKPSELIMTTRALREDGLTNARCEEGKVTTIQVEPMTEKRTEKVLEELWKRLASRDAAQGTQACVQLYGSKNAIEFLKDKLSAKPKVADEKQIVLMIKDLDADEFATREKAEKQLADLGHSVRPMLENALVRSSSVEARTRLTRILDKTEGTSKQLSRGIEVLVALKTPEATGLLKTLAEGPDKAWLTQTAKQALARIKK